MKKILALVLSLICIFALCACGSDDVDSDDPSETAGMENPVSQSTREMLLTETGLDMCAPEGASDAVWSKIDEESPIAQLDFKLDGKSYCYRSQKTAEAADISGVYLDSPEVDESNVEFSMYLKGGQGVVTWFVDGISYSVYMESGADFDELLIIHDTLVP